MKAEVDGAAKLSRRALLKGASAGGFVLAFYLPTLAANEAAQPDDDIRGKFAPNAFIRIDRAGTVTLVMPQVEMGQGVYTSIAMLLAEELDADFSRVLLEHAPPDQKRYANPILGIQITGNSCSVRAFWRPLRTAGATARDALVQAAAARWNTSSAECTTSKGEVMHAASGRRLGYGELAEAAAAFPPAKNVVLKDPAQFELIGQPVKRLDTPDKVTGKTVYGIDVMLPGMKFATVMQSPVLGGKVRHVDEGPALRVPGVRKVVVLDDVVAVVGDYMWAAKKGLESLAIEWDDGPNGQVSSRQMWEELRLASTKDGIVARTVGDVQKGLSTGERIEAAYELPLLAHAPMEPINCTVHLQAGECRIWIGTQVMGQVRQGVADLLGMPPEKVVVRNHLLGGGFGRRLEVDMALVAVRVAQQLDDTPVKVVWTREEDVRHDIFRPMYRDVIAATLSNGRIDSFKYKICGSAVIARRLPSQYRNGIDRDAVDSAVDMPYDIPNFQVEFVRAEPKAVRTGFWRGVGANNNVFAIECFVDELAKKASMDPIAFRRGMLGKTPRLRAALDLVAARSGWGEPLAKRVGRGVCVQPSFGSLIATVIEVEVDGQGEVDVRRVTSVVDTGIAVHPDQVVAQIQGGLIFGLTAALYGEITLAKGRVAQSNFNDYRMLRIDQAPKIDVLVVKSDAAPGGIGETGTTASAPALRNAIFAATGVALRSMPVDRKLLSVGRST
ncbi:molybdopterin cofactor-binding domain-containing protein [Variovorax sp. GT1P44]|uniref:xanthine dehydrogenase family protein molybdopterin-binding subunit n=1 Tax=Variovorax sp. GT1P44 TaxID=3443742 RepID=UPI003F44B264